MNVHQQIALAQPCRFACETALPQYGFLDRQAAVSIVLTVNSGYE